MKADLESQEGKYQRLQTELGDTLTSAGVKDDHEIAALKRAKAELEAKTIDQEEELDDQAGQIQQLEQVCLNNLLVRNFMYQNIMYVTLELSLH